MTSIHLVPFPFLVRPTLSPPFLQTAGVRWVSWVPQTSIQARKNVARKNVAWQHESGTDWEWWATTVSVDERTEP
jgi:hypothetical protein